MENALPSSSGPRHTEGFRRAAFTVAALNLAYFGGEFAGGYLSGSASLFADSIDFLEDALVNFLIILAVNMNARKRAMLGMGLAALLLAPAGGGVWMIWKHLAYGVPPVPQAMSLVGLGALCVNLYCAFLLAKYKNAKGSLSKAAFLSARNDAFANIAIILAGVLTLFWPVIWPDVLVGLAIVLLNLDAARAVWKAAVTEKQGRQASSLLTP